MIVVSDTTPLHYLVLTDATDVLPALFGQVAVPPIVVAELQQPKTLRNVQAWIASAPAWLVVQAPKRIDPSLRLHPGECQAIGLAEELGADYLLIDDKAGREAATRRGLRIIGTLGILGRAASRNLIDLHEVMKTLRTQTNFRMTDELEAELLGRHQAKGATRKRQPRRPED